LDKTVSVLQLGLVDYEEACRLQEVVAAARLGLDHVVITSVARDDLPDG
jgi:lipoate synthase